MILIITCTTCGCLIGSRSKESFSEEEIQETLLTMSCEEGHVLAIAEN